jgi:hypothetical protein
MEQKMITDWNFLLLPKSICTKTNRNTPWIFAYGASDGFGQWFQTNSAANIENHAGANPYIKNNADEHLITFTPKHPLSWRLLSTDVTDKFKLGYQQVFDVSLSNANLIRIICTFFQLGADYLSQHRIINGPRLLDDIISAYATDLNVSNASKANWIKTLERHQGKMIASLNQFAGLHYLNETTRYRHKQAQEIVEIGKMPPGSLCPVW